jgi:hypothetical protein
MIHDILIVGSGASAVHAAYPLVEAGLSVSMLDFGNEDRLYRPLVPEAPFFHVRRTDPQQHRYFLGDRFEGIPLGSLGMGPQLTPPRQYIPKDVQTLTPVDSKSFFALTSLALGGLAGGWGAGAMAYGEKDLRDFPITREMLAPHFEKVAERIGVSGEIDDLFRFDGELKAMLPPLRIDENAETILEGYRRRREKLNAAGFYMGKPRVAALSRLHRGRGPDRYLDMSFWSDADRSVWRPAYTLKELHSFQNFSYRRPLCVHSFKEGTDGTVEVACKNMESGQMESHRAKKLVLAASVFGTTPIVLRSLNRYGVKVPLVCAPYTYYPMVNVRMLGKVPREENHSLAQLCIVYDPGPGEGLLHGRIHSYRSLLNFKIIKQLPLPYREGIRLTQMLVPSFAILALDQEDRPSPEKYCILHPGSPDRLEVVYSIPEEIRQRQLQHEKAVLRHLRKLGCYALKRIFPGYGISLRYGGPFPMSREEKALTVDTNGLLRGTRSVYIVDSSVFPYTPSKGTAFTMMANANRIAEQLCKEFR